MIFLTMREKNGGRWMKKFVQGAIVRLIGIDRRGWMKVERSSSSFGGNVTEIS